MSIPFRRPAVSVRNKAYAMASSDGVSAEITLYGDIYETRPTDWYGDPVKGEYITLDEFLEDLKRIEGCREILIRMNSYGGDAGVSSMIHNRLRELARNGAKLTCQVDGVAMSGGSIIMCACDTVRANPSSLIMIHKCWCTVIGGYNADELRQMAEENDAWDKMQVECYRRKTGLSEEELLQMMSETTFMTGREAKDKGFVDELLEGAETKISASADGRSLFVFGRQIHLAPGLFAPDTIPTVAPGAPAPAEANNSTPGMPGSEGGNESMTMEELRAQHPELVAQIEAAAGNGADRSAEVSAAVQAERDRLAEIDEIAGLFDPALVREAKYGESRCTAAELTLRAARAAAKAGSRFLADADADGEASGTGSVPAAPAPADEAAADAEEKTPEEKLNAARALIRPLFGKEKEA